MNKFFNNYKTSTWLHVSLLLAAGIVVYLQTLSFDLVYCDDFELILKSSNIKSFDVEEAFTTSYLNTNYYRPVVVMTLMFDYAIGSEKAFPYHFTNLLLHLGFVLCVYFLLKKLGASPFTSAILSLLFAIHPVFLNSVAWIVGRNDIIYGIFCLLSFIVLLKYHESKSLVMLLIHFLCLGIAFFSKETALIFPAILVTYFFFVRNERDKQFYLKSIAPGWFVLYLVYFLLRANATLGKDINNYGIDIFLKNLRVFPEYLAKFFFPANLSVLPTYNEFNTITGLIVIALLAVIAFLVFKPKNNKLMLWSIFWLVLLVLPNCFLALKNANDWNEYLDSRFYLPAISVLLFLMNLDYSKIPSRLYSFIRFAAITVFVVLIWRNFAEAKNYSYSIPFYTNAVEHDSSKPLFQFILAKLCLDKGLDKKGEKYMMSSVALRPNEFNYNFWAGEYLVTKGNFDKAEFFLNKANSITPGRQKVQIYLTQVYAGQKRYKEAVELMEIIEKKWPDVPVNYYFMSLVYLNMGKYEKADHYADLLLKKKEKTTKDLSLDYYRAAKKCYEEARYELTIHLMKKSFELDSTNKYTKSTLQSLKYLN